MRIALFSDCHRETDALISALEKDSVDRLIGLGDFNEDGNDVAQALDLPVLQVAGNGDWPATEPARRLICLGPWRVYLCHGHHEKVKSGLLTLAYQAREYRADLVLFGHTHQYLDLEERGIRFLNPGSAGQPPYGQAASYMLLELEGYRLSVSKKILNL